MRSKKFYVCAEDHGILSNGLSHCDKCIEQWYIKAISELPYGGSYPYDKGFVYFIGNQVEGPVKIGKACESGLWKRLAGIQIGNPLELCYLFVIACENYHKSETRAHEMFQGLRIRGEWFDRSVLDEIELWK